MAVGLLSAGVPVLAQPVPDSTSNTPQADAIGPSELQNFSLPGTTTRPSDRPTATPAPPNAGGAGTTTAPSQSALVPPAADDAAPQVRAPASGATRHEAKSRGSGPVAQVAVSSPSSSSSQGITPAVPNFLPPPARTTPPAVAAAERSSTTSAVGRRLSVLPWLFAAILAAVATIFFLWRRNHQRESLVGGADYDLFVAPEPAPAVPPATIPPRLSSPPPQASAGPLSVPPQPAAPRGIVASRLRPALELGIQPLRCLVDDEQVTIEFEVELFNSGTAPARAVVAEASLFNASANQDQDLAAFYAKPPGAGDRIDSIPPMRRMSFTNRVVAPRAAVQEYELAGRKSFVPVLAFNAQYEWSGGKGQSSLAFLLGRETGRDKLGPLHLDSGQREVGGLGARVLPTAVRT